MVFRLASALRQLRSNLQFKPDLEAKFQAHYFEKSLPLVRLAIWLAISLYAIFGILDFWMFPKTKVLIWTIKGFVIFVLLVGFSVTYAKGFKRYWQLAMVICALAAVFGVLAKISVAHPSELGFQFYYAGLMLVIMWVYTLSRLRYSYATILSLVVLLSYEITVVRFQDLFHAVKGALPIFMNNNFFLIGSIIMGNIAGLTIETYIRREFVQQTQTEHERERADQVLYACLPAPIAERLKHGPHLIADRFDCASILFADIVNFTHTTAKASSNTIVHDLNQIFFSFDSLVERYGLEKIKTIGDAYMVAAGIPIPREDHAEALAQLALDMREAISGLRLFGQDRPLHLRIGINSGEVVAGVIGKDKLMYDLWGITVNIASRMESQGVAGKIQVAEGTHRLLKNGFDFEERGEILVKGLGLMKTYFLTGARQPQDSKIRASAFDAVSEHAPVQ